MDEIYNNVFENSSHKQNRRSSKYNENAKLRSFLPGDIAYIKSRSALKSSFNGP